MKSIFKRKPSQKTETGVDKVIPTGTCPVSDNVIDNEPSTVNVSTQTGPSRQTTSGFSSMSTSQDLTQFVRQSAPSPSSPHIITPHATFLEAAISSSEGNITDSFFARSDSTTSQPQKRNVAAGVEITADDITDGDIVIAVMGATGVGKTTFINAMRRGCVAEDLAHHELDAGTKYVTCMRIPMLNHGDLVLVDTPGFDDPSRTNAEVLTIIAKWLERTYRKGRLLNGLVFLQRITDIRLDSGAAGTLNIFRHLYGGTRYDRVALVTSMWNDVPPNRKTQYEEKEQELMNHAWKTLLCRENAPLVARFDASDTDTAQKSAFQIIADILKKSLSDKVRTRLQQELVDQNTALPRTEAGKAAFTLNETVKYYFQPSSP